MRTLRFPSHVGSWGFSGVIAGLAFVVAAPVWGHDDDAKPAAVPNQTDTQPEEFVGQALVLPTIDGPMPWSSKPVLSDPDRFSIAIMTDRTGGHRPGIWMKAVDRLNWLRPEFVVSVGDLIEGYTNDESEIDRQWKEFLGFIDKMQMKFFFVAGNHDVTNPTLHRIWREKFGPEWYSFDYKGVHFVCLSSEDPTQHIGEAQLAWIENDLNKNRDARWTLVFLHKPLWTYAERELKAGNEDPTNWKKVEQLLVDRPHTVFAGHVHHYVQYHRNGHEYYSLATTGGGSQLRGLPYGEFDHITWLTMEQDGPRIANLLLDGIQPAGVVTEDSISEFRQFLAQVRIDVKPIFISDDALQAGEIDITVRNGHTSKVLIDATILGLPLVGLDMESQSIQIAVEPGQSLRRVVPFKLSNPVDLERFRMTTLNAAVSSTDEAPLRAEYTQPVLIDREYKIPLADAIQVDGDLGDWGTASWWRTDELPRLSGATASWNGSDDASFSLAAAYDGDNLVFAARVTDEQIVDGDALTIILDPRPLLARLTNNRLGREAMAVTIQAPSSDEPTPLAASYTGRSRQTVNVQAQGFRVTGGYEMEWSIPLKDLVGVQGANWGSLQLGARLSDVDESGQDPVEVLWRSSPDRRENRSLAHVIRE